jgi:hypothetical protein
MSQEASQGPVEQVFPAHDWLASAFEYGISAVAIDESTLRSL